MHDTPEEGRLILCRDALGEEVNLHDIIQIRPEHQHGGEFVTVTEVKPWGVQGYLSVSGPPELYELVRYKGFAYTRVKSEDFIVVGHSAWVAEPSEEKENADDPQNATADTTE